VKQAHRDLAELVSLKPGETLSPETARRFQQAALRWLRHREGIDLARRLGWGTRQKANDALRNDLLRQAAEHLPGTVTQRAAALAELCRDMENRLWALWQGEAEAPASAGPARALLFKAKCLGADLPGGVRTVFDILADAEIAETTRMKNTIP